MQQGTQPIALFDLKILVVESHNMRHFLISSIRFYSQFTFSDISFKEIEKEWNKNGNGSFALCVRFSIKFMEQLNEWPNRP